jgi:hypothetical protein
MTDILAYLKRTNFSEQILYLLSCLNRDDCEFFIILFYKFAYNFFTKTECNFFSLQNLFRKISSF